MGLNKRQTNILHTIICHPGISGEELAQGAGISTRTLAGDIELINGMIESLTLQIENRRGAGFFCNTAHHDKLQYLKTQLVCRNYYSFADENDFTERVGQIIRTLLMADDYVKMDDIAETLWLTRSSINQELKDVRRIVKRYGLELSSKPHYGIAVIGSEASLRQCLTDFCKPYFHTLDFLPFLEDGYSRYGIKHQAVKDFHHITAAILIEKGVRTSDQALQRLVIMLHIMQQRIKKGKLIELSPDLSMAIKNSLSYETAAAILDNTIGNTTESETCFLTLILLANADFYHTPGYLLDDCGTLYLNAIALHDQLQDFFREQLHIVFSGDVQFSHTLIKLLLQFIIRKELGISEFEYAGPAYELASRLPVSRQLACETLAYLEQLTGYGGDQYLIINFTLLFYNTVMSIPSSHKKLRMLCVGPHNLYYSRSIGYKIKSQHHNYVDTIDYCTAYELSSIDLRKYDYLLTTEPAEALPAQTILPVLELQYFLGWKDLYDFRNQVILPQISTETLFHESSLAAFDQLIDCDSLDEFVAWASRRQTQNSEARIQAMIRYNTLLPILPANGTVALYCSFLPPGTGWNTRLFKFVNPIRHGSQTVPYAIVCAIPLNFDTNILKVTDSLLRRVLLDENRLLTVPE